MNPTVYIETTIVSYLTAWPRKDALMAGQQALTREWWQQDRSAYDLYTSAVVRAEASAGDAQAAAERLKELDQLRYLDVTPEALTVARALLAELAIPAAEDRDAAHVAIATVHGMDYLLTWNCRHLANAALWPKIVSVCTGLGYTPPIICTPQQLRKGQP